MRNPNPFSERADVRFEACARFLRVVFLFHAANEKASVGELFFHRARRVTDLSHKGGWVRHRGVRFDPRADPLKPGMSVDRAGVKDISAAMDGEGRLKWEVPAGAWTVIRYGATLVNSLNQEAPIAGRGLESDKLSRTASLATWDRGLLKQMIEHAGPRAGKTLIQAHIDSYEEDCQNWTPTLRDDFKRLRHYDPLPFLPALSGRLVENDQVTERFLWDYRRTLADLFITNWYGFFTEYCHRYGLETTCEPYGCGNFDYFEAGSVLDVPSSENWAGENFESRNWLDVKRPPSSAHVWGKPIINCETFTGQPYTAKFLGHPYRLKGVGDFTWCRGVNRFVFHTYQMQPWTNLLPGMSFGPWGTEVGRNVTWWGMGKEWISYLSRAQYLLQQGNFAADILVFAGENEVPGMGPFAREELKPLIPDGFDYDFCDRTALLTRVAVKDGELLLPNGARYRYLLLWQTPGKIQTMTPAVAKKLGELVKAGATLIGGRPEISPSLEDYPACDRVVKSVAEEIWGDVDGTGVKERRYGTGRVIHGKTIEEISAADGLAPDFAYRSSVPKLELDWIHRQVGEVDIYYVASRRPAAVDAVCTFRVAQKQPEFWHPETGRGEATRLFKPQGATTEVPIHFEPRGSVFVVFRQAAMSDPIVAVTTPEAKARPEFAIQSAKLESRGQTSDVTAKLKALVQDQSLDLAARQNLGTRYEFDCTLAVDYTVGGEARSGYFYGFEALHLPTEDTYQSAAPCRLVTGPNGPLALLERPGAYNFEFASGKSKKIDASLPAPIAIDGPWEVRFQEKRGAPAKATFKKLISWPEHAESGIKYFSGTGTYIKTIIIPVNLLGAGRRLSLDLGRVEVMAETILNGRRLGTSWKPPFRVDITEAAKAGANQLEVRVVNLWVNRLIGDEQLPDDIAWRKHSVGGYQLVRWPDWLANGIVNAPPPDNHGRVTFYTWKLWGKDDRLVPSGLIGPVRLVASEVRSLP